MADAHGLIGLCHTIFLCREQPGTTLFSSSFATCTLAPNSLPGGPDLHLLIRRDSFHIRHFDIFTSHDFRLFGVFSISLFDIYDIVTSFHPRVWTYYGQTRTLQEVYLWIFSIEDLFSTNVPGLWRDIASDIIGDVLPSNYDTLATFHATYDNDLIPTQKSYRL